MQGIEDGFIEQWHQKLHQNTTPEDITICEAYLAFLESNNMDNFWRVAWDNGRLTPETLARMDQPITSKNPLPVHRHRADDAASRKGGMLPMSIFAWPRSWLPSNPAAEY